VVDAEIRFRTEFNFVIVIGEKFKNKSETTRLYGVYRGYPDAMVNMWTCRCQVRFKEVVYW
jgi:hypothetical protein